MGVPTVEKAPGIKEPYLGMWRFALKDMQATGVWTPVLRPLLDEMIDCRRLANEHLAEAEACPIEENRESGLTHMHAGFASSRAYGKRAQELATELGLTPRAKRQLKLLEEAEPPKESDAFAHADQLAQRREAKGAAQRAAAP